MLFRREIADAIDRAVMLAGPALLCFQVPLDADPERVTGLRIVQDFADIADRANVLGVHEAKLNELVD